MGFQAIFASFLQSCFFLIKVFQEFKVGGQIDRLYTLIYRDLSRPLLRRALNNLPTAKQWRSGADRKKGGGNIRDIIAVTSGSPQGSPRTPLGWLPVTCRRHVPVVYSSPRSQRPHLLKDSSLYNLSCSTFTPLQPPVYKVPLYLNPSYSFWKDSWLQRTRLFVYIFDLY